VIAAWPNFALTASYVELLMRQVRQSAARAAERSPAGQGPGEPLLRDSASRQGVFADVIAGHETSSSQAPDNGAAGRRVLPRQAWQLALANRVPTVRSPPVRR
jgi:hypothetical protein